MGRAMLIMVSGLMVTFGIVMKSLYEREAAVGLPERSVDYYRQEQGKNITSSLVDLAIQEISKNIKEGASWNNGWGGAFEFNDILGGGTASVIGFDQSMTGDDSYPSGNLNITGGWDGFRILLHSVAEFDGSTTETEVLLQRDSFSKFAYFTNTESSNIYFFSSDTVKGPMHTNGVLKIAGSPVFQGYVTSPNMWEGHTSYDNNPQFLGGSNFGIDPKVLPDRNGTQISSLISMAQLNGMRFSNPLRVEMGGSGEITVLENTANDWSTATEYVFDKGDYNNKVISSDTTIELGGTLNGRLTVHSERNVKIISDLIYATNPLLYSSSTDLLGIVAEENVIIGRNAHSANGSSDITIQGSLMALIGKFYVEEYWDGSPRGQINLLGGIIQDSRGAVGTFYSSGSINSGYSKNYNYDSRLLTTSPPLFPREGPYSIVYWQDNTEFNN